MALVVKDRVKQTTTTTGTGSIVLNGSVGGYQTFSDALATGDTTYYALTQASTGDWEVGLGTWTESTTTLARTTILASSNSNAAINLTAQAEVFITQPASKAVFFNADGDVDLTRDPQTALQAATKQYVDTIAAAGLHYHDPVRVEQEGNLSATYNNGTAGVGATLTNNSTQAALSIDGVTLSLNDRVLIYEQTDATQNGVYTVTDTGSASTNWVLTRSTDTDSYAPSDPDSLGQGDAFFVLEGDAGAGELYVMNTEGSITFGTTDITFTQVASTAVYSAGTGMTLTGTEFAIGQDVGAGDSPSFSGLTINGNATFDTNTLFVNSATNRVGIGNTSPSTTLDVSGTINTSGNITVGGTVDGRDVATDGSKLDGIEAGATADQTASEILTAIKTVDGSGSGLDADTVDGTQLSAITHSGDSVAITGAVTGSTTVGSDGSISIATTATSDPTLTLSGDASGSATFTNLGNATLSVTVANDSHTHAFNNLTGKTSGTGEYSTSSHLVSGRGSGGVALTINDGYGNANITFNHKQGVPEQNGNAARIEVNTDGTTNANMNFEVKSGVTSGTTVATTSILNLSETQVTAYKTLYENSNRVFTDGYHPNADKWTTARTLSLSGDASGSVSWDGSANATLSVTVADDSHNHVWGNIDGASVSGLTGPRFTTSSGYIEFGPANTSWAHIYTDRPAFYFNKELYVNSQKVFNDGYHPNADKWTTARTLSLSGDASGSVSWDGSANATLSVAVANDSHTHDGRYYTESESDSRFTSSDHFKWRGTSNLTSTTTSALKTELLSRDVFDSSLSAFKTSWSYAGNGDLTDAGRLTELAGTSWLTWTDNSSDNVQGNFTALVIAPNTGGSAGKMFVYNDQGSSYSPGWREIWTSESDGSGSGLDADTVDGIQASSFLRSDANDTASGSYSFTNSYNEFGNSTGSVSNDGSWNARLNLAGSGHARLDVKSVSDGIITTMYSHTGQGAGKIGTYSNHPLVLMTNGASSATLSTSGSLSTTAQGTLWGSSNDGSGSGLDADLLDGVQGSSYLRSDASDTFTTLSGTQLNLGSQVQLSESTDRADLLQITSSTSGWAGLQIRNSSNEGRWSFMTDGASAGIYDDENNEWAINITENGQVALYHNGVSRLNTTSTGFNVGGSINDVEDIYLRDRIYHDDDTNTYIQFSAADTWRVVTGGIQAMLINNAGVDITGSCDAASFTSTSDIRLKENLELISSPSDKLNAISGYSYNFIKDGKKAYGVVAQEVEQILPNAVRENDEGTKSVDYNGIIALLVETVKEQGQRIAELEEKVAKQ